MPQRGRYESRFLRAIDPARPRGLWIRQTMHRRPGEAPTVAAWCTVFGEDAPWAVKQSGTVATATLDAAGARGSAQAAGRRAAWELSIAAAQPPLRHLPSEWMYRAPLPRTKLESPQPDAVVSGWVELDGERLEVAGWPGVTGHNWGTEHAATWTWVHGTAFADVPGAWVDVAIARVRIGRALTPWVANGAVALDGIRLAVGGLARRARVTAEPGRLAAALSGPGGVHVKIAAAAPLARTVGFEYTDPGGGGHDVLNCSVAELRVRVERPGRPAVELATGHGGAYELGLPAGTPHGVTLQPYPDP